MSRYIDADELLMAFGELRADYNCFNELERPRYEMWSNAIDFINTMAKSSIDIVRCKECKWNKYGLCHSVEGLVDSEFGVVGGEDFCSRGEREGE